MIAGFGIRRRPFCPVVILSVFLALSVPNALPAEELSVAEMRSRLKEGVIAFDRGQPEWALELLLPLAENEKHGGAAYLIAIVHVTFASHINMDLHFNWLRRSAQYGFAPAYMKLFDHAHDNFQFEVAYGWALRAAKAGYDIGFLRLSEMICDTYSVYRVVPHDPTIADAWLTLGLGGIKMDDPVWKEFVCGDKEPDSARRIAIQEKVEELRGFFRPKPLNDPLAEWREWASEASGNR